MTPGRVHCCTGVPGVTPGALSDSAPPLGFHCHPCLDPNPLLHLTVHLDPVGHLHCYRLIRCTHDNEVRAMRAEGEMVLSSKVVMESDNESSWMHSFWSQSNLYSDSHMHCTLIEGSAQRSMQVPMQAPCSWESLALGTVHPALHEVIAPEQYMPHDTHQ